MTTHRVEQLRGKVHLTEPPDYKPLDLRPREILLESQTFYHIADYTRSRPTGPSAGRIYRKNLHWTGPPSNWFVYFVIDAPDGDGQLHVPYRAVLV